MSRYAFWSRLGLCVCAWVSFAPAALAASSSSGVAGLAKTKPIRAVSPPARVSEALAKTGAATVVVLSESSQSGRSRYVVDNRHGRAETWTGGQVSLIQIGVKVYAPSAKRGCYELAKRSSRLLPNIGGMLLPSGVPGTSYKIAGRRIRWSMKTTAKYQPHGTVKLGLSRRIVSATVYSGPGEPLTAAVGYPAKAPVIQPPTKVC